ncbi:MAG: tetraacyldisaccharide 4'-kinase [Thauera phenolivorans]|uniref:Tetraacyldisaccharide 4'-kinase n=1 Tax=Thauera phenolivorans TaxID=1792543 RepID=A0A7X7LTW1_9RHOO|nr:tetraacyldisaccharide 4'-kinase [Thauera phenolivorans]NLF53326.1 tetraacyldisaccharide 4'-kinase [Thauera phenolivorans]
MAAKAPAFWFRRNHPAALALLPLSLLFRILAALRRRLYRAGVLSSVRLPVPVIVVGNIAVGGSGKTPVVEWLVRALVIAGRRPGIVSRGYGSRQDGGVALVPPDGDPVRYGDEPVLLARLCGCPVAIGRDRPAAAQALLQAHPECDVLISDDGMQHYRLARDLELAVVDERVLGNCWPLPAGPLREPLSRLATVELVIAHGDLSPTLREALHAAPVFPMQLEGAAFRSLTVPDRLLPAAALAGRRVHAVAGIGRPQRFFDQLASLGLDVVPHPFPDHHRFVAADLDFGGAQPIVMTSKDAVKCAAFAPDDCWEFPVRAQIGAGAAELILEKLNDGSPTA